MTFSFSAYEVWGSPEMLSKEKIRRARTRQDEYEGKYAKDLSTKSIGFSFQLYSV